MRIPSCNVTLLWAKAKEGVGGPERFLGVFADGDEADRAKALIDQCEPGMTVTTEDVPYWEEAK